MSDKDFHSDGREPTGHKILVKSSPIIWLFGGAVLGFIIFQSLKAELFVSNYYNLMTAIIFLGFASFLIIQHYISRAIEPTDYQESSLFISGILCILFILSFITYLSMCLSTMSICKYLNESEFWASYKVIQSIILLIIALGSPSIINLLNEKIGFTDKEGAIFILFLTCYYVVFHIYHNYLSLNFWIIFIMSASLSIAVTKPILYDLKHVQRVLDRIFSYIYDMSKRRTIFALSGLMLGLSMTFHHFFIFEVMGLVPIFVLFLVIKWASKWILQKFL